MDPEKFRTSRRAIKRLCENLNSLIEQNDIDASRECCRQAHEQLDKLIPEAEGEVQKRSVKNLGLKIKYLKTHIDKLKVKKSPVSKAGKIEITGTVWDEDRIKQLSTVFLNKVFANMAQDPGASVCFSTTGKGIRPSYQIRFENQPITAFSGNTHKPKGKPVAGDSHKLSKPFAYETLDSILNPR